MELNMKKISRLVPLLLALTANLVGFGVLYFSAGKADTTILYISMAILAIVLVSYSVILFASLGDEYLFLIVSMIFTIGIISLLRLNREVAQTQISYFYVGMVIFFAAYFVYRKNTFWDKPGFVAAYIALSVFLFVITLALGSASGGAKNWILLGPIGVQPSEIIKIFLILALAGLYTYPYKKRPDSGMFNKFMANSALRQLVIMAVAYMNIAFLILQREWGSALLYFMVYFTMQYIFGKHKVFMFLNVFLACGGAYAGVRTMAHIQERIAIWRAPFEDPGNLGYQIVQSLYAMASGGVIGSGIGGGHPGFIPLVKNDFIFSAICEELGMVGGVGVILLFFILVYRGIRIALQATNPFNKAVAVGVSAMFGYQSFIIIGGVTKFIPMTGITLPFVSAGGSSLAACFMALAILQAISGKEGEISDVI